MPVSLYNRLYRSIYLVPLVEPTFRCCISPEMIALGLWQGSAA
jgi:hypothetical protein